MSISHTWSSSPRCLCICARSSSDSICSEQPRSFLNPACSSDSVCVSSRCFLSRFVSSRSMTFNHVFMSEMGLWSWGSLAPYFLGIRHIKALLSCSGTWRVVHMCCTRAAVISMAAFPPCFRSSAAMPSGPGAFLLGSSLMTNSISSFVGTDFIYVCSSCHSSGLSYSWYSPCQ